MIGTAADLAQARGWEHDILSTLSLAVAIPSPRWRKSYNAYIFCSIDGGAWGFVIHKEFEVMSSREPEASLAVCRLRQFFMPDEIDILPAPQCQIRYARDVDIDGHGKVENQLGRAIDEVLAQNDTVWAILMLVNWGDKSADEAIADVTLSELQGLRAERSDDSGKAK